MLFCLIFHGNSLKLHQNVCLINPYRHSTVSLININQSEFRINRIYMTSHCVYINKINLNPKWIFQFLTLFQCDWLTWCQPYIPIYSMGLSPCALTLSFHMRFIFCSIKFVCFSSFPSSSSSSSNPKCIIQRVVAVNILRNSILIHILRIGGERKRAKGEWVFVLCGIVFEFEWKISVSM